MFAPPPPLREKTPNVSLEVEQVVMTAPSKDPKQRFDSVRAFATALQQASKVGHEKTIISPLPKIPKTLPTQGSRKWSFKADGPVTSSPTVVNGIVYFGSVDGTLYALNAASGQQKWSFPTSRAVYSSPAVVNCVVYFGSNDGKLYALDASSEQKLWSFQTGDKVQSSPTVVNGIVYFGSDDGHLYAIYA